MSSQLTSLVPVLSGPNYQQWAGPMRSYLMSQGQWRTIQKSEPTFEVWPKTEALYDAENALITPAQEASDNQDEVDAWAEANDKALGNILLRLVPDIQYKYRDETNAANLLRTIEKDYGKPGVIGIYLEFKHAMDVRILEGQDPTPALDKFASHIS
jgi:hypothetical protein